MHAPHQPTAVWLLEAKTRALETSSRHSKRADRSFKRPLRRTAVFFFPKKTRQLDLHSDFFDPLGRSVEQRNASPHHEQPCSFAREVHSHTCIGRSQRFVVFVGDSGSFFPPITHERFKRKLTRTPGPTEAQAMHHTGTQAPSQRPADEKAEQGGRRIITSQ